LSKYESTLQQPEYGNHDTVSKQLGMRNWSSQRIHGPLNGKWNRGLEQVSCNKSHDSKEKHYLVALDIWL